MTFFNAGIAHRDRFALPWQSSRRLENGIPSHVTEDLNGIPQPTNVELRERMSGNICRCGAYSNIAEAIAEVAGRHA
jgi:hypothetical protein